MKGFVASVLAAVPKLVEAKLKRTNPPFLFA